MRRDSSDLRVPFGLREDRLVRPDDVSSGLACNCVCPECKTPLQARHRTNPNHRSYFSHQRAVDCPGGYETAVHSMAIQIIHDKGHVTIPEKKIQLRSHLPDDPKGLTEDLVFPDRSVAFKHCVYETRVSEEESQRLWRPDLTATLKNDATMYIEVAVTHESDIEKTHDLDNLMEIDLSMLPRSIINDPVQFENEVLHLAPRKWFRCSLYDDLPIVRKKQEALRARHQRMQEHRILERAKSGRVLARQSEARLLHASNIKQLHAIMQRAGYIERMNYLSELSETGIACARQRLVGECRPDESLPAAVTRTVTGDWVFNGHPIIWQGFIFDNYIYQKSWGTQLFADSIADAVVQEFGLADWAEELLSHSNTTQFRSPFIWFLNVAENETLRKPEVVIGHYLESLSRPPLNYLKTQSRGRQYEVRFGSAEQRKAFWYESNKADEARRIAVQEQARIKVAQQEQDRLRKEQASQKNWLPENERIERNIRRLIEMDEQTRKHAYLCGYCHCPFDDHTVICPECGVGELRRIKLTKEYVTTFGYRLHTMSRIRVKKDYRDD